MHSGEVDAALASEREDHQAVCQNSTDAVVFFPHLLYSNRQTYVHKLQTEMWLQFSFFHDLSIVKTVTECFTMKTSPVPNAAPFKECLWAQLPVFMQKGYFMVYYLKRP